MATKNIKQNILRYSIWGGSGIILFCLFFFVFKNDAEMKHALPPQTEIHPLEIDSVAKSTRMAGFEIHPVIGSGSMVPYFPKTKNPNKIVGYVIVDKNFPFENIKKGDLVIYTFDGEKHIGHQAVEKDSGGWIMSGLNNKRSEAYRRVTKNEYYGKVISSVLLVEKK